MTITFSLPWPNKALSPNSRIDRRSSTKIRQAARDLGFYAAKEALQKNGFPSYLHGVAGIVVIYSFHAPNMHRYDLDNALSRLKAANDGIALALGVDDSDWNAVTLRRGQPVVGGRVDVEIEAIKQ